MHPGIVYNGRALAPTQTKLFISDHDLQLPPFIVHRFNRLDSRSHQANLPLKLLKSDVSHRCPQHQRPLTSQLPSIVSEPADVQISGIMIYLTHATLHDPTKKVRQSRLHAQRSSQQN
jgi:hypothetical protein